MNIFKQLEDILKESKEVKFSLDFTYGLYGILNTLLKDKEQCKLSLEDKEKVIEWILSLPEE